MRQEEVDNKQVEEVGGKVNNRQGRRLGEAEGIAAYNRVDTPFAVPGLEELDGISPVTKAPRKISSVNRRIRPASTSRKINRRPSSSRPSSSRPSSRSFPRFPRPTFYNLPRFPASFPAETPNQPAANPRQAPLPFNPHPQAAVPQGIHPQAAHPQQALHPQAPQGFPAVPRNNFFQQVNAPVQPHQPSFPFPHQGFPQSEGSLPGRSFTGLFDPFRNFFPNFHAPQNGLPQIPERPRSTLPTPSPATTPATTPPWKKKSVRKKGTSGKKRFWVVTDKPEPTTAPTTTQRPTSSRRTTTPTTTRRPTTTSTTTTTTTTRPPVPQEFPRRIAI